MTCVYALLFSLRPKPLRNNASGNFGIHPKKPYFDHKLWCVGKKYLLNIKIIKSVLEQSRELSVKNYISHNFISTVKQLQWLNGKLLPALHASALGIKKKKGLHFLVKKFCSHQVHCLQCIFFSRYASKMKTKLDMQSMLLNSKTTLAWCAMGALFQHFLVCFEHESQSVKSNIS
ncbi:hypothetical protein EGR_02114 [Echinococcus granulosus]|uniref:Uncharacterized protein n=1 Tax=Echinococcus granulosus TaxID=6210 RepID=W6UN76_ECHGR|nr:hypothetical protein EGR_02114 [Echinococcus granulosus]EUB63020.1 hypothetical protein EGR_02114 [Echinococcus granulosus]